MYTLYQMRPKECAGWFLRAKLVGEKTFGTGTVFEAFSLSDGSALMLAIEEWLTPAGHVIWHQGISPDVVVTLPPEVTPLLPVTERGLTAEELRESRDLQLLRGLELLTESSPAQSAELIRLNGKYKICCDYGVSRDEPKTKSLLGYPP